MKTTLIIPDPIFRDLKRRAAERHGTLSELVTEYLSRGLHEAPKTRKRLPRLPSYSCGLPLIDIADRERIYRALDAERHARLYGRREKG